MQPTVSNPDVNASITNARTAFLFLKYYSKQKKQISEIKKALEAFDLEYNKLSQNNLLKQKNDGVIDDLRNKIDLFLNDKGNNITQLQKQLKDSGDYTIPIDGNKKEETEKALRIFLDEQIEVLDKQIEVSETPKSDFNAIANFFLYLLASILASVLTIVFLGLQNYDNFKMIKVINDKINKRQKDFSNDWQQQYNILNIQKQELEQQLNSLQQAQDGQQQRWQQQYNILETQLRQARGEKERIDSELIITRDENHRIKIENHNLLKKLKDLESPPDTKPDEALSPEIAQLVNTYNSNLFNQYARTVVAEVDVDDNSYANYRKNNNFEQVILKTLNSTSSKYLIVCSAGSSTYLLFPKEKVISKAQSGPVQALFRCNRFKAGSDFTLKKPAQVSPIAGASQQEWRLEKQGELDFIG
ncbi:peptidoglycan-binding protein [Dolichospermum sp. ST_sed9]|nr:peptidoglycan-binding protein [Dolichospermum sp. ST_sed9]